jgi:hypothetical protein
MGSTVLQPPPQQQPRARSLKIQLVIGALSGCGAVTVSLKEIKKININKKRKTKEE